MLQLECEYKSGRPEFIIPRNRYFFDDDSTFSIVRFPVVYIPSRLIAVRVGFSFYSSTRRRRVNSTLSRDKSLKLISRPFAVP